MSSSAAHLDAVLGAAEHLLFLLERVRGRTLASCGVAAREPTGAAHCGVPTIVCVASSALDSRLMPMSATLAAQSSVSITLAHFRSRCAIGGDALWR